MILNLDGENLLTLMEINVKQLCSKGKVRFLQLTQFGWILDLKIVSLKTIYLSSQLGLQSNQFKKQNSLNKLTKTKVFYISSSRNQSWTPENKF